MPITIGQGIERQERQKKLDELKLKLNQALESSFPVNDARQAFKTVKGDIRRRSYSCSQSWSIRGRLTRILE
ncbi:hypothetical protein ACFLTZ_06280 [Chloroflexota bacterium]